MEMDSYSSTLSHAHLHYQRAFRRHISYIRTTLMRKLFLLASYVLAFLAPTAGAQTPLEGMVHDAAGKGLAGAHVTLQRAEGTTAENTTSDGTGWFHFPAVEAGAYTVKAEAPGFYPIQYDFVLRSRQPISLNIELPQKQAVQQSVEVKAGYRTIDPEKTGSSYTFTHQDLEKLPDPITDTTNNLVNNLMPGVSPQIFETVDLMTGGFTPEYGNRFGGVLDITTRSGADLGGHGDLNFRGATVNNYDFNADYGGQAGRLGYYFFVDGFTSGRYLDPPEPKQLFDFGKGSRATAQFDWRAGNNDSIKLLLMGSGTNFQQPNITDDQAVGRDAQRHLRQFTAILGWLHTFSPQTLLHSSVYERTSSDQVLPTSDLVTPLSSASRSSFTLGIKSDLSHSWRGHFFKAGIDFVRLREGESFFFDSRGDPDVFPAFQGWGKGGQASFYLQEHFSPVRNLTVDLGL